MLRPWLIPFIAIQTLTLNVLVAWPSDSPAPIEIGFDAQLFLDDYLIESMEGLERRVNPINKSENNPVLSPTEDWEGPYTLLYGSVIREEDRFRMWYYGAPGVCYAESEDGIHWTKPALDLSPHNENRTNIVIDRNSPQSNANPFQYFYELFGVLKDPNEPDPNRRYKMGVLCIQRDYEGPRADPFHSGQRRGLGVATSPDGIHWNEGFDFVTEAICDGATHFLFDPVRKKFVVYGRTKWIDPALLKAWDNEWADKRYWGRAVARAENGNVIDWPESTPGEAPRVMAADQHDPPGTEIYGMNVFFYEGIYIALIQMFYNQPQACYLDIQLGTSRDGLHFERLSDRSPFIPVGDIGEWDRFNQSVANNPPLELGDDLRFYYSGRSYRHSPYEGPDAGERFGAIGFGEIERDRFASLEASYQGGTLVTKPLQLRSTNLSLNAKADFGEILVSLIGENGNVLAVSNPVQSSGLTIPITWESAPTGFSPDSAVRIRFVVRNARIYSFRQLDD